MNDTKERILTTALRLFARDGYEAVSVSDIAQALGMTKGALYRHYKSKRDLFDSMIARMLELDSSAARQYDMPEQNLITDDRGYDQVDWDELRQFTLAQFRFWTEDDFACPLRRMLSLEQYRSGEMARLHSDCLTAGPVAYMAGIFQAMAARGAIRAEDPETLALEFYAPLWLLICACDGPQSRAHGHALLEAHIDRFIRETSAGSLADAWAN